MANSLIDTLKNLFIDTKTAASEGNEDKLEDARKKLQNLQTRLDVRFRTVSAELESENKALFSRPASQRLFYFKNVQLIKKRVNLVGSYKMSVDKALQTIQAAQDQIKFARRLEEVKLNPELVNEVQVSLMDAQNRVTTCLNDMSMIVYTLDSTNEAMATTLDMGTNSAEDQKIQELLDRVDTCMAAGDEKGAQAAKAELDAIGGLSDTVQMNEPII